MSKVRCDAGGLYIVAGGRTLRPGAVNGYGHAMRMDDGGLRAGDTVRAAPLSGATLGVITLPDGTQTYWHIEGPDRAPYVEDVSDFVWDRKGRRVYDPHLLVSQDGDGPYLYLDETRYRPGAVEGFGRDHRMDDGRLRPRELVAVRKVEGTPLLRVSVPDDTRTFWHAEGPGRRLLPADEVPAETGWEADGRTLREPAPGMRP